MNTPLPPSITPLPKETPAESKPSKRYNPLGTAVEEKSYSMPSNQFTPQQLHTDLGEPTFMPPPMTDDEIPKKDVPKSSEQTKKEEKKEPPKAFNPDMNELSDSDKHKAAEQMATYGINLYEQAHVFGNEMLKISEKKIAKLQMEGTIDLSVAVPYDIDQYLTLGEFFKEYNNQCGEALTVEKEWKEGIIPPLTRVLAKRGHGMSDEQTVIFMFAQHLSVSVFKFINMKSQLKSILEFGKEHTATQRTNPSRPTPQQIVSFEQPQAPDQSHAEAPVIAMDPQAGMTLQEKALQSHSVHASTDTGLPAFGGQAKLATMDQIHAREQAEAKAKKRIDLKNAKQRIKKAASTDAPPTGQPKKRGRKPGSRLK